MWQPEEYSVQFYDAGGRLLTGEDYTFTGMHYGDVITVPGLDVTDLQVIGWSLTKDGEIACRVGEKLTVTEDTALYVCVAAERVCVTYKSGNGQTEYGKEYFGKGIPGYLTLVPTVGGTPAPVTAWSTQPGGKGTLYPCLEDGRSEKAASFTEDTTLYAVTGKVYNYNEQLWFDTLGEAVRSGDTLDGHTLIVYRDTVEPCNIRFNKSLYVLSSGNRTVAWKKDATAWNNANIILNQEKGDGKEFVGCMNVSDSGSPVTVTFGDSDIPTLSMGESTPDL